MRDSGINLIDCSLKALGVLPDYCFFGVIFTWSSGIRHQDRSFCHKGPRASDRIATRLGIVTEDCTKLSSAGVDFLSLMKDGNIAWEKTKVRKLCSSSEIGIIAED